MTTLFYGNMIKKWKCEICPEMYKVIRTGERFFIEENTSFSSVLPLKNFFFQLLLSLTQLQ